MRHRDIERRVQLACIVEDQQRVEGFKSTDEHERLYVVFLEAGGDGAEVDVGEGTICTELGASTGGPAIDTEPGEFVDIVVEETAETVVHGEWGVALFDAVADSGTCCGVHPSSRRANAVMGRESEGDHCASMGWSTYCIMAIRIRCKGQMGMGQVECHN